MHKITKGLKKKKKGKKSKRGEDELFKPEELEKYRREHQGTSEEPGVQNEEWKKFIALTSEVDDILKKTQGDLDRIKNTSFFQKKPTETQVKEAERQKVVEQQRQAEARREELPPQPTGIVEVSESESEEEEDDTLFDTDYIDVIATGEVKLAYIPESPTEQQEGDDPFDTSYADRAILGPETQRKGRKLVPLGSAVEVLTGRVQLPTCATQRPTSKRQIFKEKDLLLGSFDASNQEVEETGCDTEEVQKTLLDDDSIPLPDEPIDLSKSIIPPQPVKEAILTEIVDVKKSITNDIVSEFESQLEDNDDLEFEELAFESLSKSKAPASACLPVQAVDLKISADSSQWGAFDTEPKELVEEDPFDTTFAENILPNQPFKNKNGSTAIVNNQIRNEGFLTNLEDRISEKELNLIKPADRDLLGGSNIDLSINSGKSISEHTQVFDPFEITDIHIQKDDDIDDDDFDPRADEKPRERTVSRPDVLNIGSTKTVSFDLPSPELQLNVESKIIKPLTPFYVRKNSVPELPTPEDDPFDTSFAVNIAPGKAELKVIESELFDPIIEKNINLEDNNFDPRDERRAKIDEVLNTVNEITKPKSSSLPESVDLLAIDNNIAVKVLTPGEVILEESEELSYRDPFDTSSITTNILPGKTELKLLESELIYSDIPQPKDFAALDSKPVDDLLVQGDDVVIDKPLSPVEKFGATSFEELDEDFDPFDTSCANNIKPGPVELKLLESEFI